MHGKAEENYSLGIRRNTLVTKIKGGTVVTDGTTFAADVYIRDGKILAVTSENLPCDEEISAHGLYVSPAFIDIHIHGAHDSDFLDSTAEAFKTVAKAAAEHGAGTIVPTVTSSGLDSVLSCIRAFESVIEEGYEGANMPGLHLEGPYFSPNQSGAQSKDKIHGFCREEYMKILDSTDSIIRWSAAPELDGGASQFAKELNKRGILASIGHSDADSTLVKRAFDVGFTHVTHLYSCTSSVHRIGAHRHAGVVEAAYLIDDMTVEIIADGVHLPPDLLRFVYKFKGADRIALVTDSMRGAGMPDGPSMLGERVGGLPVVIERGCAYLPDKTAFAGSVSFTDRLVRNMVTLADVPLSDAVKMATCTPARIMGFYKKGSLSEGFDADIVIFDENIKVHRTVVGGKTAYKI